MKRRILFYIIWSAISFCISILIFLITSIVQVYPLYLHLAVYVLLVLLSSASFAILFNDKWWVSLLEGVLTSMCTLFLLL